MNLILLKKDSPILLFKYNKNDKIQILEIYDNSLLPLNIQDITNTYLKDWLLKRCISKNRPNVDKLLDITKTSSNLELSFKNHSRNLVDFYWTKTEDESLTWVDVNFRTKGYSESIGNLLLKNQCFLDDINSPDINTNGVTEKAWKHIESKDFLFKLGRAPFYQEPYNEIACAKIAKCFPILNAVPYFLGQVQGKPASVCQNFLCLNEEFIPASYLIPKKHPQEAVYMRLSYIGKELGMKNIKEYIDNMIAFDYVINNTDRHLGNFGFLRDANSGIYKGPAPIFDNGNSLWFDEPVEMNFLDDNFSKPFCNYHKEQLRLTKHLDNVDFINLRQAPEIIKQSLLNICDVYRVDKIAYSVSQKIDDLYSHREKIAMHEKNTKYFVHEEVK